MQGREPMNYIGLEVFGGIPLEPKGHWVCTGQRTRERYITREVQIMSMDLKSPLQFFLHAHEKMAAASKAKSLMPLAIPVLI